MKTFEIEVQEILSRVISVEAENPTEAISTVEKLYKNEEIVLDYNDFKYREIKPLGFNEDKNNLIKEVIDYLFEDEKKHFEECGKVENHIYLTLVKLRSLIN
jgi:hypothetical protein